MSHGSWFQTANCQIGHGLIDSLTDSCNEPNSVPLPIYPLHQSRDLPCLAILGVPQIEKSSLKESLKNSWEILHQKWSTHWSRSCWENYRSCKSLPEPGGNLRGFDSGKWSQRTKKLFPPQKKIPDAQPVDLHSSSCAMKMKFVSPYRPWSVMKGMVQFVPVGVSYSRVFMQLSNVKSLFSCLGECMQHSRSYIFGFDLGFAGCK